jgi:hypothetical protein
MHTQSHSIEAIAYDERSHLLWARYRDTGETVIYEGVPQEVYDSLLFSDSIGRFVRDHIEGRFAVRRN